MLAQLADVPADTDLNTLLTAVLYVLGALAGGYGVLQRSHLRFSPWFCLASLVLIVGPIAYYLYVVPALLTRVYILNFGLAAMILFFAVRLRGLFHRSPLDRLLLVLLVLIGAQFIPRTALTAHTLVGNDSAVDFAFTPFWHWTVFSTAVASVMAGLVLFAAAGADRADELIHERDTDPLTGLPNRRGMETHIAAAKGGCPSGWIAVCDIDYFKTINDAHGHAVGDAVLKEFAGILQAHMGQGQFAARTGGEEFVLLLGDMTAEDVFGLLESMREQVRAHVFDRLPQGEGITCSFGCVRFADEDDFWRAAERADKVLYDAKKAGRNRTIVEGFVWG